MAGIMKPYLLNQAWFETLDFKAQRDLFKFPMGLYLAYIGKIAKPSLEWVNFNLIEMNDAHEKRYAPDL